MFNWYVNEQFIIKSIIIILKALYVVAFFYPFVINTM